MNKIYHIFLIATLLLPLFTTSCVEEYNAELPVSESRLLVVEGTILSDSVSTFYLSLTMPVNSEEEIPNVNNATLQLKGTDGTSVTGTFVSDGKYQIETPKLNADAQYSLVVTYDGDTYESDAQTPFPSVAIQNVEANQPTSSSSVNILITTDMPKDPSEIQYYRWTYVETWEVRPEYYSIWYWDNDKKCAVQDEEHYARRGWKSSSSGDIIASSSAYYTDNQIKQYKLYGIERDDQRLFVEYSTEVVQRSLRKAEYEYETERKKISTEMGGLFTPQPSALPTNIHCTTSSKRALGYVGCSLNVARYRMFTFPDELNIVHKYTCDEVTSGDDNYPGEEEMYKNGYYLVEYFNDPGMGEEYDWSTPACVDVTRLGCFTTEPSFWIDR